MSDVNDKLERLIVRSLDGMLDDEQQLDLDRQLIRNPQARRMMDEYRHADQLAVAALSDIAAQAVDVERIVSVATQAISTLPTPSRRMSRSWMLIPGVIAAAVLAMVIPKPNFDLEKNGQTPIVSTVPDPSSHKQFGTRPLPFNSGQQGAALQTIGNKQSIRRRAGTEWIGVVGDDGNVYWIEVERSRTIRTPQRQPRTGGTFLEM